MPKKCSRKESSVIMSSHPSTSTASHNCRFCQTPLTDSFADLGQSPSANHYRRPEDLQKMEPFFPLHALVCKSCFLVQLPEFQSPEDLFGDYAYFSSYASSWVAHAKRYADKMIPACDLNDQSLVIEIASNDGYLLQHFKDAEIPVLGIEPAANVAKVAIDKGIDSEVAFFGVETAKRLVEKGKMADLLLGNNVLAHVPDINDFVAGMKLILKADGVLTMEFPHLLNMINLNQFDTIYHEHFSYLSAHTVCQIFAHHGLEIYDIETLPTHGGSLRIFAGHPDVHAKQPNLQAILDQEAQAGLTSLDRYHTYAEQVKETKRALLDFLITQKRAGKKIVGYGAPAKGNTLLNYCGIGTDFLDYTVDRNPHKQDTYLPGTRIPVFAPEKIFETKPDFVMILPWNLKDEIMTDMAEIKQWGGQFVTPIPTVTVHP